MQKIHTYKNMPSAYICKLSTTYSNESQEIIHHTLGQLSPIQKEIFHRTCRIINKEDYEHNKEHNTNGVQQRNTGQNMQRASMSHHHLSLSCSTTIWAYIITVHLTHITDDGDRTWGLWRAPPQLHSGGGRSAGGTTTGRSVGPWCHGNYIPPTDRPPS